MQKNAWNTVANEVDFNLEIDLINFVQLIPKTKMILDYGCGYGRNGQLLTSMGYKNVIGVDTSPELINRGKRNYPHLSIFQSKDYRINFPDNHFEAVLICAVLTCVPDDITKTKIISEIKRVLKPCGIFHMVEFCSKTEKRFKSNIGVKMHHQAPKSIEKLVSGFSELVFEINRVKTMNGQEALAINYFGKNYT